MRPTLYCACNLSTVQYFQKCKSSKKVIMSVSIFVSYEPDGSPPLPDKEKRPLNIMVTACKATDQCVIICPCGGCFQGWVFTDKLCLWVCNLGRQEAGGNAVYSCCFLCCSLIHQSPWQIQTCCTITRITDAPLLKPNKLAYSVLSVQCVLSVLRVLSVQCTECTYVHLYSAS